MAAAGSTARTPKWHEHSEEGGGETFHVWRSKQVNKFNLEVVKLNEKVGAIKLDKTFDKVQQLTT